MATVTYDFKGMRCPEPQVEIAKKAVHMKAGDIMEVDADCPTFEKDVISWCQRRNKVLLATKDLGNGIKRVQIQF